MLAQSVPLKGAERAEAVVEGLEEGEGGEAAFGSGGRGD